MFNQNNISMLSPTEHGQYFVVCGWMAIFNHPIHSFNQSLFVSYLHTSSYTATNVN